MNGTVRKYSLAHLTVLGLSPPEVVRVAARTGYDTVGLRLLAVPGGSPGYPLMHDRAMMRETKQAMRETGVGVLDVEFVRITPETEPAGLEAFFAAGAELGARYAITAPYDPDHGRLADRLGALTDIAAPYGIRPVLEFFPWTSVSNFRGARAVVEAAGRDRTGILVDTLHFDRCGSRVEELDGVPASLLPFLHVADAPVHPPYTEAELLHAGRVERLPPGEGAIDIGSIVGRMPAGIPIALEVPMTALAAAQGYEAVARRARDAARNVLRDG